MTDKVDMNKLKLEKTKNVAIALRNRSSGFRGCNSYHDPLHLFGESCSAEFCTNNKKSDLPVQSRSTFMTAFSPDQHLMASCHGDHNVYITKISSGKVLKTLVGHQRTPWCVAFHPSCDGILATGCLNGEVRVWDVYSGGSESWTVGDGEHTASIQSLSFHPTDHVLLIASGNEICFWDWSLPKPFASIKTNSPNERVQLVRFDSHGLNVLTGIVNIEEDANSDEEPDDDDGADVPLHPQGRGDFALRRQWLQNWTANHSPVFSVQTSRARPSQVAPGWTGHNGSIEVNPNSNQAVSSPSQPASTNAARSETNGVQSSRTHERLAELRSRMRDISNSHSNAHQRILYARINVNAEIQQQYNRLQALREERRQLELRLEQLRNSQRPLVSSRSSWSSSRSRHLTPSRSTPTSAGSASSRISRLSNGIDSMRSSLQNLEQSAYNDYNEITEQLAARVQRRLWRSLNDSNVEVSIDWRNPTSSSTTPSADNDPPRSTVSQQPQRSIPALTNYIPLSNLSQFMLPFHRRRYANDLFSDGPEPESGGASSSTTSTSPSLYAPPVPSINLLPPPYLPPPLLPSSSSSSMNNSQDVATMNGGSNLPSMRRQRLSDARSSIPQLSPDSSPWFMARNRRHRSRRSRRMWRYYQRSRLRHNRHPYPFYDELYAGRETGNSYRLQWWDFSKLELPEISRNDINVIVRECKIHNDSSVDVTMDNQKLAALLFSQDELQLLHVGVFSLEKSTFGQLLYRKDFAPNQCAVCVSFSPLGNFLAVGLKHTYLADYTFSRGLRTVAEILKFEKHGHVTTNRVVRKVEHPINPDTPHRFVNINTIAWLPSVGEGIVYGTNSGELRICYTNRASIVDRTNYSATLLRAFV